MSRSRRSSVPRLFRPIEVAEQLLLEAREQIVAESHHPNLLDNLDAAEEIFVLNGRLDRLHRIAEYRPLAMLARGDHASAVANSLATYSNTSLPVTTRLRAGMTVLLALGTSDDRKAAASHILGYAQMADRLELDEAALCIHAALARCRISVVLAEAGLPTVSSSAIGPHPTRTFESVRRVADDLVQDLDQKARKLGTVELSDPMVPLTPCLPAMHRHEVTRRWARLRSSAPCLRTEPSNHGIDLRRTCASVPRRLRPRRHRTARSRRTSQKRCRFASTGFGAFSSCPGACPSGQHRQGMVACRRVLRHSACETVALRVAHDLDRASNQRSRRAA